MSDDVEIKNVVMPEHYMSMMYRQCCQNCRKDSDPWHCPAMKIVLVWKDANDNPTFHGNTEWYCEGYDPKNKP